ncbi:MAG: hypothetical protein ABIQ51_04170 [Mesorhizobium sp.]|uniref:hypothetical protein n=1 Tax=Mesorhizobium sp. INR15 TaxID=2654248 RepID=UPI0018966EFE|nr:hypothetical protein [Mesorhizobium sp. INR15]QPC95800.1 hypothetical protein GA829_35185 [Mesorhizobium sp. INR15]
MKVPKPTNTRARFGLSSPRQLLAKLRHDLERLRLHQEASKGPKVTYAAMDCAVTIVAIRDWTKEAGRPHIDFKQMGHFRLAVEVANGFKHSTVKDNPLQGFSSGSVNLMYVGGKPISVPHWNWIGHGEDVVDAHQAFEEIANLIEAMMDKEGI